MSRNKSLNSNEAIRFAKKLKYEDPEQFHTLVRMHLSFVLDLNMEDADGNTEKSKHRHLKWGFFETFTKKSKGPTEKMTECTTTPLTKEVLSQVFHLIHFLMRSENLEQEGIFRRSGKVTRQQELKCLLNQGVELDLEEGHFSVHDCASVLKSFLAELPEPLLTEMYYPAYCQIADLCQSELSHERMLHALQLVLLLLPVENRRVMKELLRLLHLTASHSSLNRMSAENLATLFTPHLLCPRKLSPEAFHVSAQNLSCIIVFMIKEGMKVFDLPPALATDIKAYWDRRKLTPNHMLEDSVTEAKTVFSFVDRAMSGGAGGNNSSVTEKALAQLYAHVQALPESSKKRRLVSKFNKENGQGTPKTKTGKLGESIKKHIFYKGPKAKSFSEAGGQYKLIGSASSGDELNSPENRVLPVAQTRFKPGPRTTCSTMDPERMPLLKPSLLPPSSHRRRHGGGGRGSSDLSSGGEDNQGATVPDRRVGDVEEESPLKVARITPPLSKGVEGSDGHTTEQEACNCSLGIKSLSLGRRRGQHHLDHGRVFLHPRQLQEQPEADHLSRAETEHHSCHRNLEQKQFGRRGFSAEHLQQHPTSGGPELLKQAGGFRPVVIRRSRNLITRRPTLPTYWRRNSERGDESSPHRDLPLIDLSGSPAPLHHVIQKASPPTLLSPRVIAVTTQQLATETMV